MTFPAQELDGVELSYADGAQVACGFGTVYEGLMKVGISGADAVLITGLGPVGLATGALCRKLGAEKIIGIEVIDERLKLASDLGVCDVVLKAGADNVAQVRELTGGAGVERAVDCSASAAARATAIRATRKWGKIVMLGEGGAVEFNPSPDVIHDPKTIYGSWVTSTWLMEELVERLVRWKLHPADLVTHRFALDRVSEAYSLMASGKCGKVAVCFDEELAGAGRAAEGASKCGKTEAVWANKGRTDCVNGTCVLDLERGVVDRIWDDPWQTDTCIGHWHYDKEAVYKSPKIVIDMLVDIVSRNGNLLLNFPLPSNGMLDDQELKILDELTRWMSVNGEAIHGTRPWQTYGSGAASAASSEARPGASGHHQAAAFNERNRKPLTAADIRFTQKAGVLYAFAMGRPEAQVKIPVLAPGGQYGVRQISNVELLGAPGKLAWTQDAEGLTVQMPAQPPSDHAISLKIIGA